MASLNPLLLAATTPDPDPRLLPLLRSDPALASKQDAHGYSLLHAAASYNHVDLLRTLVSELGVNVNLIDEDGETCLFVAETVEVAKCLVEDLHIDTTVKNDEGETAAEKIESEDDFADVATYLRLREGIQSSQAGRAMPPNMRMDINTVPEAQVSGAEAGEPDPEFRRRIEDLASKEDFNSDERQQELRDLITDAVRGVSSEERDVRRRME